MTSSGWEQEAASRAWLCDRHRTGILGTRAVEEVAVWGRGAPGAQSLGDSGAGLGVGEATKARQPPGSCPSCSVQPETHGHWAVL